MRLRLGRGWLRHPGALLVLVSVACQGVPAVLLRLPGVAQWDDALLGIGPAWLDEAALVTSAAMTAFSAGYLLKTRRLPNGPSGPARLPWVLPALARCRWLS